jgi:hypothetical protein
LATHTRSGSTPDCSIANEERAGTTEARLDLVGDQHDAVLVAQLAQSAQVCGGRRHEPALALDRLDHDGRHRLGGDARREGAAEVVERPCGGVSAARPAVLVGVGDAIDLGRERPEAGFVGMLLRCQRHGHVRTAVERSLVGDHRRPARRRLGDLDGVLDGLGAAVEECGLRGPADRQTPAELLGQLDVRVVRHHREVRVQEARDLRMHGARERGVGVADGEAADAACEVDEGVAVDVGDEGALGALDEDRNPEGLGVGDDALLALDPGAGARARDLRANLDGRHAPSVAHCIGCIAPLPITRARAA